MSPISIILLLLMVPNVNNFMQTSTKIFHRPRSKNGISMELALNGGGSYVALATPMLTDGKVDEYNLKKLVLWHLNEGTNGIVALGTTGEASTLNQKEKIKIIQIVKNEISNKIPLVVGTGGVDPVKVLENTKIAAENGADACLMVTPYYVKPTQKGLVKFYEMLANESDLPIVLYNVPGRTGVDLKHDAVVHLSMNPGIIGIKDATGDLNRVKPLLEKCEEGFLLYSGDDISCREFVEKGGHGVISVTANVAPNKMAKMVECAAKGLHEEALEIDEKLSKLHTNLFVESNPIPVKWALSRMGRIESPVCRLPLTELENEHFKCVEEALAKASCL